MFAVAQCEVCHSPTVSLWAQVAGFPHYRCRNCKHLFVHPRPSKDVVEQYYQDATFYHKAEADESRLTCEAQARLCVLTKLVEEEAFNKSLLDVGCASGIFMEQAQRAGWIVEGVEMSPVLCEKARSKGLNVVNGQLENVANKRQYSVITAWEVIEHAINPEAFLSQLSSYTQRGGFIALSTPLSNGLPARMLQARFPYICPPEHLSLFSRQSLYILAKRIGLEPIYFRSFSNLKKDNLKRGLQRFVFDRTPFSISSFSVLLSSLSATLLQPLPRLVDAMGMGAEMEIVFKKVA